MEAIEPHIVRIRFAEPPPASFLYQMREPVLPKHIIEAQLQKGTMEEIPFNRHPVGSGPFRADAWLGKAQLRLTAFEDYWDGRPYLDTVVVRADYENTQTLWAGLMREEVDVVAHAAHQDLESIARNDAFEIVKGLRPSFSAIAFNCRKTSLLYSREALEKRYFDLLWIGGTYWPDPDLCALPWHSADPLNYSGFSNEEVDRLIEQGKFTYDFSQRVAIYRRFHLRIVESLPTLFICRNPLTYVQRSGLKGTELLNQISIFRSLPEWYWETKNSR